MMKRIGWGCFWVLTSLLALLVFGTLLSTIGNSFIRGTPTKPVDLVTAPDSALTPHGNIADTFALLSNETTVRRDTLEKEIKGNVILWRLPVLDVSADEDQLTIETLSDSDTVGISCTVDFPSPDDLERAAKLHRGDLVTCKGLVEGRRLFGGLNISPAIIIWD